MAANEWSLNNGALGYDWQGACQYQGRIYVGHSLYNSNDEKYFACYDVAGSYWQVLTPPSAVLNVGLGAVYLMWNTITAWNGKILVIFVQKWISMIGDSGYNYHPMLYDIASDTWTDPDYTEGHWYGGGEGKLPVGFAGSAKGVLYFDNWRFDMKTTTWYSTWENTAGKPVINNYCGTWEDNIWIRDTSGIYWYYDTDTFQWVQAITNIPSGRYMMFVMDGLAYFTTNDIDMYEYDISAGAFTSKVVPSTPSARWNWQNGMSPGRTVYYNGLWCRPNDADSTNRYALWKYDAGIDPVVGDWTFFATTRHSQLEELNLDNHTQYLNNTRHDVTARHTLGTVVPHDDHGLLSGLADDDHPQYYNAARLPAAVDALVETGGSWEPVITGVSDTTPDWIMHNNDIVVGFKE